MRSEALSRRDLLATFLGTGAALAACRRASTPHYQGELWGPDHARGHRLRDGDLPERLGARAGEGRASPEAASERARVVVVGAGPAGLSAAWRLIGGGLDRPGDVVVLELEDAAGGTSRAGESAVTRYPWGAHYVPVPSADARALGVLLDEVGVVEGRDEVGAPVIAEEVLCRAPEERLYYRGTWYEGLWLSAGQSRDDRAQWHAFRKEVARLAALRDGRGRRAFVIPTAQASDDADVLALDAVSMSRWMDQRALTSPRLRWLVDYACRDDYGLSIDDASAWAGLFYFASRLGPDGRGAPLMTWPEGNGRLVRHLAEKVGTRVRTGATVADVSPRERGNAGVAVTVLDREGVPRCIDAERVIVAAPRFVARRIVGPLRAGSQVASPERADAERAAFDYGAWAVCNLHLDRRPDPAAVRGVPFAWDNVLYESRSLGYVVATHQTGLDHGPTVWTWYYALTDAGTVAREKLLGAHWREWADVAFSDLAPAHPGLARDVARIDVWRWGHAMVRPRVGARAALLRARPHLPIGNVHFAHTDLSGVALFEEAHDHGVRAAEEVLDALGVRSPSIR